MLIVAVVAGPVQPVQRYSLHRDRSCTVVGPVAGFEEMGTCPVAVAVAAEPDLHLVDLCTREGNLQRTALGELEAAVEPGAVEPEAAVEAQESAVQGSADSA